MKNIILGIACLINFVAFSQEMSTQKLDEISADACGCISEISLDSQVESKNEEISNCITSAIMSYQIANEIMEGLTTKVDSITKKKIVYENDSIVLDSDKTIIVDPRANYDAIEQNLLERCPALREVLETNNVVSDVSMSDKKKAKELYKTAEGYYIAKDFKNAKIYYKKAVRKDRNFAFAWDMLGLSQRNLGEFEDAIKSYEKSLKIDPSGKVPLQNIGVAYEYLKNYPKAISSYKSYIQKYPEDPEGFYGVGRMYLLNGDSANGADAMMQAYLLYKEIDSPYVNDAVNVLSEIYAQMKADNQLEDFNKLAKKYNITFQ